MRLAISIVASLLLIAQLDVCGATGDQAFTRLRPMQHDAARALAVGTANSTTFRELVERIEHSHVIVYIDLRPDMPSNRGGSLRFLARSATDCFVKISLNRAFTGGMLVALLGHELQHAAEVADAGDIASASDLRKLYRRVGERTGPDQFDTVAARRVGYVVRQELSSQTASTVRLARASDAHMPDLEELGDDSSDSSQPSTTAVPAVGSAGQADTRDRGRR
jgi:hypothetical protein